MQSEQPAKLLRIHISEGDMFEGRPLYEAIVQRCRELQLAGVTVFRGLEGYGETAEIHRKHLMARDQPIIIVLVDSEEKITRALPSLEALVDTGMIAASPVTVRRVRNSAAPRGAL